MILMPCEVQEQLIVSYWVPLRTFQYGSDRVRYALLAEQPGGCVGNGSEEAQPETGRPGRRQPFHRGLSGKGLIHVVIKWKGRDTQEEYSRQNVGKMEKWKRGGREKWYGFLALVIGRWSHHHIPASEL